MNKHSTTALTPKAPSPNGKTAHTAATTEGDKPEVNVGRTTIFPIVQELLTALHELNEREPWLFQRNRELVRVARVRKPMRGSDAAAGVHAQRRIIESLSDRSLTAEVRTRVRGYKLRTDKAEDDAPAKATKIAADIPAKAIEHVLYESGWDFPVLDGVTSAPILRRDGSLFQQPGYDVATGLYYDPPPGFALPPIPESPTREDVRAAVELWQDFLCDMAWADDSGFANALGLALTFALRPLIEGRVPMALISAPTRGTGKTTLLTILMLAALGEDRGFITWPANDEEMGKHLTTHLMAGQTVIAFDNVNLLSSRLLEETLTKRGFEARVLGGNRQFAIDDLRATFAATGNDIQVVGDLVRRIYKIELDPKMSRPEERDGTRFRHHPIETYAREHHAELLAALITLYRAWIVAGRPKPQHVPPFVTFNEWAERIGGILENAGVSGFLANLTEDRRELDTEAQQWESFLWAWFAQFGSEPQTVASIAVYLEDNQSATMADALPDVLLKDFGRPGRAFRIGLGRQLRYKQNRRFGEAGLRIERYGQDSHLKTGTWRVVRDEHEAGEL